MAMRWLIVAAVAVACVHHPAPFYCAEIDSKYDDPVSSVCARDVDSCEGAAIEATTSIPANYPRHPDIPKPSLLKATECLPARSEWCATIDGKERCYKNADDCHDDAGEAPCAERVHH
jgi:hypothetical protein